MNRDGKADFTPCPTINVVAAIYSQQDPSMSFERFGKLFAGDGFHTAISSTR